jgi:adenosylcobinamide kinase / adenosylcobinamide-phosphate guanylyltransferase
MSQLTFILGGARSGKSRYAQQLAQQYAGSGSVVYVATAQVGDDEMAERVRRHQADRPLHWRTIEEPLKVSEVLERECKADVILIDCLTFFVTNHLLSDGDAAHCEAETWNEDAAEAAVQHLVKTAQSVRPRVLIVSNEVGLGLVPGTPLGRVFRDVAGRANQTIAAAAVDVIMMVAGLPLTIKSS